MSTIELIERCNELARKFYEAQGYEVTSAFKFYDATHSCEVCCWNMAVIAYKHIDATEMNDALREMRADERD